MQAVAVGFEEHQTEVQNLDGAVVVNHHVLRLEIPVDELPFVRVLQATCDLKTDRDHLIGRESVTFRAARSRPKPITKSDTLNELHYDVGSACVGAGIENARDVGMVEADVGGLLTFQPRRTLGSRTVPEPGPSCTRHLDRDIHVIQVGILRAIHDALPALTKDLQDAVLANAARVPSG
ncbi:MAG: hypothetical protein R3E12_13720 [Candidatus Eisenbacteria bacterium]